MIEKQNIQIQEQNARIEEQNAQIEEQNAQIGKQNIQIENMIQALLHARKKLFGASTEATKQVEA